jgi:hypothetical protein
MEGVSMSNRLSVIQIGHSRDGHRPSVGPCHQAGCDLILVDGPEGLPFLRLGNHLGEPTYDHVVITATSHPETLLEAVRQMAGEHRIALVFAGYETFTVVAAEASAAFGRHRTMNPPEVIARFRHKAQQRQCVERLLGPGFQPAFAICDHLEQAITAARTVGYPVVIKAEDGSGCRGVMRIDDEAALRRCFPEVQAVVLGHGVPTNGRVMVEQFIDGPEIGVCGLVDGAGAVQLLCLNQKVIDTTGNCFLEQRHVVYPPCDILPAVHETCDAIITALGLKASPFHMDLRLRGDGRPLLVETGARLSGDGLPRLVQQATGVDWAALVLESQLGGQPQAHGTRAWYAGLEFVPLGVDGPRTPAAAARRLIHVLRAGEEAQKVLYSSEIATTVSRGRKAGVIWACTASPTRTAQLLDLLLQEWDPQG